MITLFAVKYLFYLWIGLYFILILFNQEEKVNKIFFFIVGIILFILSEIKGHLSGGYTLLDYLGLFLIFYFIYLGFISMKKKDKARERFVHWWTFFWIFILIYFYQIT